MAKQTINIGTTANDGTGDPLRTAFDKVNDNFTELYSDDAGDVGSIIAGTGISVDQATGDVTITNDSPDQTVTLTASTGMSITGTYPDFTIASVIQGNATHTGDVTGSTALTIANDVIDYANMGAEFTTSAVISASDVDFSSAAVFTKTLSANTTLTFSNVSTGMVKDLVITGDFTLTLPASVKTITGTYDGTVSNLIQIVSTNGSTEQWATISQEA
jgi:hypothetical protein